MFGIIKRNTGLNSRDLEILQNKNKGVSLGKFLEGQKLLLIFLSYGFLFCLIHGCTREAFVKWMNVHMSRLVDF